MVEVLVSVVIVSLALTSLLASISEAIRMERAAEMAATAGNLAGEAIEECRAYFNSHDESRLVARTAQQESAALASRGLGSYSRTVLVSESGVSPNRTWTLQVTVNYSVGGSERSVVHQTLFAER
ncbi:MAG: hypothetical protein VB144_02820 [Clostridia bacterium]|nr:hypothetical protein [Clostridia bacterium]